MSLLISDAYGDSAAIRMRIVTTLRDKLFNRHFTGKKLEDVQEFLYKFELKPSLITAQAVRPLIDESLPAHDILSCLDWLMDGSNFARVQSEMWAAGESDSTRELDEAKRLMPMIPPQLIEDAEHYLAEAALQSIT